MRILRTTLAFVAGWIAFAVAGVVAETLRRTGALIDAHPMWAQIIMQAVLVLFVAAAVVLDRRRSFADYGFRAPAGNVPWWRVIGVGALIGVAGASAVLLTPAKGMPFLRDYGFLGVVLAVCLYSSLTEEVIVRGWFQTVADQGWTMTLAGRSLSGAVVASALFFGSMHLTLLAIGTDVLTVLIVLTAATPLGFAAAIFRQRHQSFIPAFVTHAAFNVGSGAAGVVINAIALIFTGRIIQK